MLKCLQCSRVGDDIGLCGSPITCPNRGREIDPSTDILVRCDTCDIVRAIPVDTLMKHRDTRLDNACERETCVAFLLRPQPAKYLEDAMDGERGNAPPRKTKAKALPVPPVVVAPVVEPDPAPTQEAPIAPQVPTPEG